MQISQSHIFDLDVTVEISPPRKVERSQHVFGPTIHVHPAGSVGQHLWSFTADEAEALVQKLLDAAKQSRELFPEG